MEYKYPKKIRVGSTTFDIIYDRKSDEGASLVIQIKVNQPLLSLV